MGDFWFRFWFVVIFITSGGIAAIFGNDKK